MSRVDEIKSVGGKLRELLIPFPGKCQWILDFGLGEVWAKAPFLNRRSLDCANK
jgi:hypothetical protein